MTWRHRQLCLSSSFLYHLYVDLKVSIFIIHPSVSCLYHLIGTWATRQGSCFLCSHSLSTFLTFLLSTLRFFLICYLLPNIKSLERQVWLIGWFGFFFLSVSLVLTWHLTKGVISFARPCGRHFKLSNEILEVFSRAIREVDKNTPFLSHLSMSFFSAWCHIPLALGTEID